MEKTIALVMVVKNEAKGLRKAVDSCKLFVNEIHIFVDDSSHDKTFDIARSLTDHVHSFKWSDDFSLARNNAAQFVRSEYILFIDGHEYVDRADRLQEALALDADALFVRIQMDNGAVFSAPRIYKRGVQFIGKTHETLDFHKGAKYETFLIVHDRVNGQDMESAAVREMQRNDQVPRILSKKLRDDPNDVRSAFHLMLFCQSKNDYKGALHYSKKYLKHSNMPGERWYVYYARSLCFLALGHNFRAFWAIYKASCEESGRWENEKMKGMIFFEAGMYEKALLCLANSMEPNKQHYAYEPLPVDVSGTWNLMGEAFFRLGAYDKASTAFEQAFMRTKDTEKGKFFSARADLMRQMARGRISNNEDLP